MSIQLPSSFAARGTMRISLFMFLAGCFLWSLFHLGYSPSSPANWREPDANIADSSNPSKPLSIAPLIEPPHFNYPQEGGHPSDQEPPPTHHIEQKPVVLSDTEARLLCNASEFQVHPDRATRKVYDLFLAGTELDWLDIRLNTLAPMVDYFVIVEASKTFTYHPKPLYFKDYFRRFEKHAHKIIYRVIDFAGMQDKSTWEREKFQRDALFDEVFPGLVGEQAAKEGDVILVSDLDEIPKEDTITLLKNCHYPPRVTIRSRFYYYSFQWEHRGGDWNHPQATYYQGDKTVKPEDLRMSPADRDLHNASWHCSSCFSTVAEMSKKIESFSHTEYNHARFKDPAQIVRRVRNGLDLFDRDGQDYDRVDNNEDVPTYLKTHKELYPWIVDRNPANANFIDFFGEGATSLDDFKGNMNDKR